MSRASHEHDGHWPFSSALRQSSIESWTLAAILRICDTVMSTQAPGGRILFVDDEQDILDVLAIEFSAAGFEVLAVASGGAAVKAAQRCRFDVAVTDFKMPGMDGLQLSRNLREIDPDLPIVMATGYAPDSVPLRPNEEGIDRVIRKPFSLEEVLGLVKRVIDESRARSGRRQRDGE